MSSNAYPAPVVDSILDSMLGFVQDALAGQKRADETIAELRKKAEEKSTGGRVVLEKVAAVLDEDLVRDTVEMLDRFSFTDPSDSDAQVKIAAFIKKDPNNALRLMQQVLHFSALNPDEGRGVEKRASGSKPGKTVSSRNDFWEEDGFDRILREGA